MSYPIDTTIPNAPNDPADDQPLMKQNFANISSYLNVDHVAAGSVGNGRHLQVTYNSKNTPAAPLEPISVEFTADSSSLANVTGSASPVAQNFLRNQNGIFPLMGLKAFANFSTGAVPAVLNGINIASITRSGATNFTYTVTLVANTLSSTNYSVFTKGSPSAVTIVSSSVFRLGPTSSPDATAQFMVLEI